MRDAVDHHAAGTTDPLAAIVVEGDGRLPALDQPFVYHVEHLEERHVGTDVVRYVRLEPSGYIASGLSPDLERQAHRRGAHL